MNSSTDSLQTVRLTLFDLRLFSSCSAEMKIISHTQKFSVLFVHFLSGHMHEANKNCRAEFVTASDSPPMAASSVGPFSKLNPKKKQRDKETCSRPQHED